jgi:hypothetical protein
MILRNTYFRMVWPRLAWLRVDEKILNKYRYIGEYNLATYIFSIDQLSHLFYHQKVKKIIVRLEAILNFRRTVTMETKAISDHFMGSSGVFYVESATWFQQFPRKWNCYLILCLIRLYDQVWYLLVAAPVIPIKWCRLRSWNQITDSTILWSIGGINVARLGMQGSLIKLEFVWFSRKKSSSQAWSLLIVVLDHDYVFCKRIKKIACWVSTLNTVFFPKIAAIWRFSEDSKSDDSETKHANMPFLKLILQKT